MDNTVLKTLDLLVANIEALHVAAKKLQANPSAGNLDAAARAWHAAHGTWMTAVAYLYGPAAQHDYHKRIATWPFDKVLVEHALDLMEAGQLAVDSRYLREEEMSGLRGLYTIMYFLFRDGRPREAAGIRSVELSYLTAVTQALLEDSIDFEASWRGLEKLPPARTAVLQAAGIQNRSAYAEEFKHPGTPTSRYASISMPLQEVFQEITGVLEDIVPLIGELRETAEPGAPAYWDSLDPCADLLNQLRSVENAYLGGVNGSRGRSVSELVAGHDKVLDRLIKISLAHTAYRIGAIRDLHGESSGKRELAVRVAEGELEKLTARVAMAIPLVVLDPAVRPYAAYIK
ncbi:hypothetical protein OH491_02440 [Termitidicoccus mucosus]|uniref:imelysin family protein n=1 Tax=Termitidicoccus mucosus TaxID=1184151 RepID=UPI002FEE18A5